MTSFLRLFFRRIKLKLRITSVCCSEVGMLHQDSIEHEVNDKDSGIVADDKGKT